MGRSRRARAPQTQPADSLPGSRSTNVLLEIESEQTSLAIGLCRLVGDLDLAELPVIRKRAGQQPQVSPCEKTAISDALLQAFRRSSHYRSSFRASGRNWRRAGVWAGALCSEKNGLVAGLSCLGALAHGNEHRA